MKRLFLFLAVLSVVAAPAAALATPGGPGQQASVLKGKKACHGIGKPLVDVRYTLLNDYDSGVAGNAWANDTIDRHLQIWQTAIGGPFCGVANDSGFFSTFAGVSPAGFSTVSAGVTGKISGGYQTTVFSGAFDPSLPTSGNLGSYDLQCDPSFNCPGFHPTVNSYFPTAVWDFADWGWTYKAGKKHGTWVNAASGNSGDITG